MKKNLISRFETCPIAAANAEDDLLLKNDFMNFFKVHWVHFTGEMDKFVTFIAALARCGL